MHLLSLSGRRNSPSMIRPWRFSSTTNNTTSYDLFIAVVKFISNKSPSVMLATIIFNFKFYMLWIANIILFFLTQGKSRFRKYPWYLKRHQNQKVLWKFHASPPSNIPHIIMADRNGRLLIELLAVKVRHWLNVCLSCNPVFGIWLAKILKVLVDYDLCT